MFFYTCREPENDRSMVFFDDSNALDYLELSGRPKNKLKCTKCGGLMGIINKTERLIKNNIISETKNVERPIFYLKILK